MSDTSPIGGSGQDLVTVQGSGVRYLGQLVRLVGQIFPRITGTFTMAAAATKTITDSRVNANAIVYLQATNATAGTLMGSTKSLYVSSVASGSFIVATASGVAAAGSETFSYMVVNPV